jgi:hypothetical protein
VNQKTKSQARAVASSLFALSAAIVVSGAPVQAQQSEVAALRAQMEELQARLDKLEADQKKSADAATAAAAAAKSNPAVTSKFPVQVSGLFQLHSLNTFSQSGPAPRVNDTFRIRRGELRLTAPAITSRISGTIQLDPAKASFRSRVPFNAGPGAINVDTRARDSILQEVQISYLLNKGTDRSNYIDVGQYKIPIGLESLQSSSALQLVERALIFTQRDPFDAGYGDVRDTGIQLRGTAGKVDYRLGVFNGFGDRQNAQALSDPKAVLGRLSFRPNTNSEIGVSGGIGNTGTAAGAPRADRNVLNFFGRYQKNKLTLQGEYLTGDASLQNAPTVFDIKGYYGSVGYLFTPKIEGVFRYDYLDANRNVANADVRDLILGLNYYIKGNNAKIQTNIVKRSGGTGAPADLQNDRTELRTNFQIAF